MELNLNLSPYFRRQDDQDYVYFVPAEEIEEFDALLKLSVKQNDYTLFNQKYLKYSISGSDNQILMWIDPTQIK